MRTPSRVWREQGGHDDTRVGGGREQGEFRKRPSSEISESYYRKNTGVTAGVKC